MTIDAPASPLLSSYTNQRFAVAERVLPQTAAERQRCLQNPADLAMKHEQARLEQERKGKEEEEARQEQERKKKQEEEERLAMEREEGMMR